MDEFIRQLADRFESYELCELLDITIEEFIERFDDIIERRYSFLREYLKHGN